MPGLLSKKNIYRTICFAYVSVFFFASTFFCFFFEITNGKVIRYASFFTRSATLLGAWSLETQVLATRSLVNISRVEMILVSLLKGIYVLFFFPYFIK